MEFVILDIPHVVGTICMSIKLHECHLRMRSREVRDFILSSLHHEVKCGMLLMFTNMNYNPSLTFQRTAYQREG